MDRRHERPRRAKPGTAQVEEVDEVGARARDGDLLGGEPRGGSRGEWAQRSCLPDRERARRYRLRAGRCREQRELELGEVVGDRVERAGEPERVPRNAGAGGGGSEEEAGQADGVGDRASCVG
ncbi:MAG: hypothetical protein ICV74_11670 [Thermoleophilia bacterium]|nr:hypothetical protein [Thermoleophilia bacterium]